MSDAPQGRYVIVERVSNPERPRAMGFYFEAEDGSKLTPQQIIDALSEFLLMLDPDSFKVRDIEGLF